MDCKSADDETLISLIAEGGTEALGELYDRYGRLVFSVAFHVVGDRAAAEEITLDVFTRVWEKAGTYRPLEARVRPWLTSIARHRAIDVLRKQGRRQERDGALMAAEMAASDPAGSHSDDNPEQIVAVTLRREQIRAAVALLPADQQQVVTLAYFHGYTHRQIAAALDRPLGTVKTRIRLAMQRLRQALESEEIAAL